MKEDRENNSWRSRGVHLTVFLNLFLYALKFIKQGETEECFYCEGKEVPGRGRETTSQASNKG